MTTARPQRARLLALPSKVNLLLAAVRFEESMFALPIGYIGMLLAADGWPTWQQFLWINVAMTGARTLAMSANRLIHHKEDIANPRTRGRHLPQGTLTPWDMRIVMLVSLGVFFYGASQLNTLAFALAPVAAVIVVGYSYVKYHSWAAHYALGFADGLAPAGAWIGVTGSLDPEAILLAFAVTFWVGGFDVFYGTLDYDFDKGYGVQSIARKIGIPGAILWARFSHVLTLSCLLAVGLWMGLSYFYFIGWGLAVAIVAFQHTMVRSNDLTRISKAFKLNAVVSLALLLFTTLAVVL